MAGATFLFALSLIACQAEPAITSTKASEIPPLTPVPEEPAIPSTPIYRDVSLGTKPLAPWPDRAEDPEKFRASMRACLETETPNKMCNEPTDLPLKGVTFGIIYHKTELGQQIVTGEDGYGEVVAQFDEVADRVPDDLDGHTESSVRLTLPQWEINVAMPDGTPVKACLNYVQSVLGEYWLNFDTAYSVEACDPPPPPVILENALAGETTN